MGISANQTSRTEALAIDYGVRYYTALRADVDETAFTADAAYSPSSDWTEISSKVVGPVRFSNPWRDSQGVIDWRATVSGTLYDSSDLAHERLFLAMHRLWCVATGWTDWVVWWCGYIEKLPGIRDDRKEGGEWQANVRSLSLFLSNSDAPAHRFGRRDLAAEGSASASSTLTTVVSEAGKDEFSGLPSVAASQAIDENMDSLWISNAAPSMTEEVPSNAIGPNICINEVYREPTGYDVAYRWVELYKRRGDRESLHRWSITSETEGKLDLHDLGDSYQMEIGDHVVLCDDRRLFQELFDAGDATVIEWRHIGAWGVSGVDGRDWTYDPTGDWISLHSTDAVRFGTGGVPPSGWKADEGAVTAPVAGQSIRRDPAGTQANGSWSEIADWTAEEYPSPGRHHTATDSDWEWLAVDLGTHTWQLGADLADDDMEATVSPNTDGLTAGVAQIIIGADIIDYTGKTETTLTGLTNIAGGGHSKDDPLSQYEDSASTNHWKISGASWKRREVRNRSSGIKATLKHFALYTSTVASPDYPDTGGWKSDWTRAKAIWGHKEWEWSYQWAENPIRARHVMLVIKAMLDGGRAKVNEFKVFPDEWTTGEDDTWLDGADTKPIIEHLLEDHYGLASSQTTINANVHVGSFDTQKASYTEVIAEICRRSGCVLRFSRVPKVHVIPDPGFPLHGERETWYTLDRQALQKVRLVQDWPHRIGQVQLVARNAKLERVYEVTWPQTCGDGSIKKIHGEMIVGSEQEARLFAEAHYKRASASMALEAQTSGITDEWCRPARRVAVTWDLDVDDVYLDGKLFLVRSIDVMLDPKHPKQYEETLQLMEYVP